MNILMANSLKLVTGRLSAKGWYLVLTVALIAVAALIVVPALAADTWTVDDDFGNNDLCMAPDFECSDIQAAIDAAAPGDLINVMFGVYTESLTIGSGKNSLDLVGHSLPLLDARGFDFGAHILGGVDNVTIDGFEILGDADTISGIVVAPGSDGTSILNNDIHGMMKPNLPSPASYGILVWGNDGGGPVYPAANWAASCVADTKVFNTLIQNNEIYDIAMLGVSLGDCTSNTQILNNDIHDLVAIDVGLPDDISIGVQGQTANNATVTDNDFSSVVVGTNLGIYSSGVVDGGAFSDVGLKLSHILGASVTATDLGQYAKTNFETILAPGLTQTGYFTSIQDALDNALDGGTIEVTAGSFTETILFASPDDLTITGNPLSKPVITGGIFFTNVVDMTGLILDNLYIKGTRPGGDAVIDMENSAEVIDLTISNSVIDGENVSGRHGLGGTHLSGDVTITGNEFKNILGGALLDLNSGSDTGGSSHVFGHVIFSNNNVHDSNGSVALRGNSITKTVQVDVNNNTWSNIGGNGSETGEQWAAFEVNHAQNLTAQGNDISGVKKGIYGEGQAMQLWDIETLDVFGNDIYDNEQGVFIYGGDGATYGGPYAVPGGSLYDNFFSNNGDFGIEVAANATGGPLNAENNDWNTCTGPFHATANPDGLGDTVSDNVDFESWTGQGTCPGKVEVIKLLSSPADDEIIVDDGDANYADTGWTLSVNPPDAGFDDDIHYRAAGTGSQTATWTPNLPETGSYKVYVSWTTHPNRATDAPYTVNHAAGSDTLTVNQELLADQLTSGGSGTWSGWYLLGNFNFNAGLTGNVVLSNDADEYVIADAVKFVKTADPGLFNLELDGNVLAADITDGGTTGEQVVTPGDHLVGESAGTGTDLNDYNTEIVCLELSGQGPVVAQTFGPGPLNVAVGENDDIICYIINQRNSGTIEVVKELIEVGSAVAVVVDNGDAEYGETGSWTYSADIGVNGDRSYVAGVGGSPTAEATWTPAIPVAGQYEVYAAWVAHPNRATNAPYTINYDGGNSLVNIDQTLLANGTPAVGLEASGWQLLGIFDFLAGTSSSVVLANNANGYVVADAVRLVRVDGTGAFDLLVDGQVEYVDAGDTDSTGPVSVLSGSHTVGELAGANTDLDNYNFSVACQDQFASPVAAVQNGSSAAWQVEVEDNQVVTCTITNTRKSGFLEIIKNIVPDTDPGLFNLEVDGQVELTDAADGDQTGELEVAVGDHAVGESAGTGTTLSNYSSQVECFDQDGAGALVVSGTAPVNVPVAENDDIVCTITNERKVATVEGYKFDDLNGDGLWQTDTEPGLAGWTILALADTTLDEFDVDSANSSATVSDPLVNGVEYLIKVTGTYSAGDSITADAKYSVRAPNTYWTDSVQNYESYGPELLDLQIDGLSPAWGSFNPSHAYYLRVTGDGTGLDFKVNDLHYPSNFGLLRVEIYTILSTAVTDANGYYIFPALSEQPYLIAEQSQSGWFLTTSPDLQLVNAVEGVPVIDINFGNFQLGFVSGIKYEDLNGNGFYDDSEPFLENWQIDLYDAANNLLYSQLTDSNGYYEFANLLPGDYILEEIMLSYEQIIDDGDAGYSDNSWSLATNQGYNSDVKYTGNGGGKTATWMPNLPETGSYKVYVSWTTHPNRATDAPYTVNHAAGSDTLTVNQELLADQLTSGGSGTWSGWYLLGNFNFNAGLTGNVVLSNDADEYVIADAVKFVRDWEQSQPGPANNFRYEFSIATSGTVGSDINFGNYIPVDLTVFKYRDEDFDGIYDSGEELLDNWLIEITNLFTGFNDAGLTALPDGTIKFVGLRPGPHLVKEVLQSGWIPFSPPALYVELVSGQNLSGVRFGNEEIERYLYVITNGLVGSLSAPYDVGSEPVQLNTEDIQPLHDPDNFSASVLEAEPEAPENLTSGIRNRVNRLLDGVGDAIERRLPGRR